MEYIYAAMLLHKTGKKVDEASLKHVLDAAGFKAEEGRLKAVVAALEGINIDDAIKNASVAAVAAPAQAAAPKQEAKKEDKKKEEKKSEEEAAAGLGSLFG